MRHDTQAMSTIEAGTAMQKPIPPRLVEPYLTGRRAVIAGFVYRMADCSFADPADYFHALDLGYNGSEFKSDMREIYLLRWIAGSPQVYQIPYSAEHGGDWTGRPPFTGTGYTSWPDRPVPEFYVDLMPIPVGTEIYRIVPGQADFIARYDGQVWLRPAEGI
ncbi:MAG TPA: hypothetical protein VNF47_28330 [Streptosporangiaceae bacterium]|nr:hypothetical protein [Streptosporangiaceae bacterium]